MHAIWMAAIAASAMGVDVGWQPAEDGGLEYIIQIEPHQVNSLKSGDVIEVGVRPQLQHVRRYRIVVGNSSLPRCTTDQQPAVGQVPIADPTVGKSIVVDPSAKSVEFAAGQEASRRGTTIPTRPIPNYSPAAPKLTIAKPELSPSPAERQKDLVDIDVPAHRVAADPVPKQGNWTNTDNGYPRLQQDIPEFKEGVPVPVFPKTADDSRHRDDTIPDALDTAVDSPAPVANDAPARTPFQAPPRYAWPPLPQTPPSTDSDDGSSSRNKGVAPETFDDSANVSTSPTNPTLRPALPPRPETTRRPAELEVDPELVPAVSRNTVSRNTLSRNTAARPKLPTADSAVAARTNPLTNSDTLDEAAAGTSDVKRAVEQPSSEAAEEPAATASRPWLAMTFTLLALFASIGGNIYLGWVTWDIRNRFRELVFQTRRKSAFDPNDGRTRKSIA